MSAGTAPFPAPHRRNLALEAVQSLREQIISGALAPGRALAEPTLARHFGVSRAPIREALIELEREGLVQFEKTGRTRVRTLSEADFREIMEARVALESMAASRAAQHWGPDDSAFLLENIAAQSQAPTLSELSRLDVELHAHIMERSGNQRLLRLWQSIRWQFEMCLALTHRVQKALECAPRDIAVSSHRRLLQALASGKPEFAARTMASHIENSMEWAPIQPFEEKDAAPKQDALQKD